MATYRLKDRPPFLLRRRWITVLWLTASLGVSVGAFMYARADWLLDIGKLAGLFSLAGAYSLWRIERQIWHCGSTTVEVSPEGIRRTGGSTRERCLRRDEIASIGDLGRGAGFVVRGVNPVRVLIVPRDLEGLESCRAELVGMGIAVAPSTPNDGRRLWTFGVVCWSIAGVFVASSRAVQIACGAICAVGLLVMWAAGWLRTKAAGQSCALPVRSPEEAANARRTTRRVGVGLIAAAVAGMIIGTWWTHGTGSFGLAFLVLLIGVLVFAGGFFEGSLRTSVLAFLALAGSGAALGGLIWWFDPSSDLGPMIAFLMVLLTAVFFVVSLVGRRAWAKSAVEILMGPALIGVGLDGRFHGRRDYGVLLAAGILITLVTIAKRSPRWEPVVWRVAFPLKVAAIGLALASLFGRRADLALPCLMISWSLPDRTSRIAQTSGPGVSPA